MKMHHVQSSTIRSVGYDKDRSQLHVHFKSGGEYVYHDVPEHVYLGLLQAPSVGKAFVSDVKGQFQHTKMG